MSSVQCTPRLPVLGWHTFSGPRECDSPSLASHALHTFTTSGRAAILLALRALGLSPGERVLLPTYHCPTMIAPVVLLGGEPVFYPLDEHGGVQIEWLRAQDLRGVRALLAAHFFGLPQPMSHLRAFCDAHGIALIEDCAHAFFGCVEGRAVGSWGDYAIGSLTKFFPVSEGGVLVSRTSPTLAPRTLRHEAKALVDALEIGARHGGFRGANALLRAVFALKNRWRTGAAPSTPGAVDVRAQALADSGLHAPRALSRVAEHLFRASHQARIVRQRRRHYTQLVALLSDRAGIRPLSPRLPDHAVPYVMPLWADAPEAAYHALRAAGVPVFRWCQRWPAVPDIPGDAGGRWSQHVFQLGCHQDLSAEDITRVASTVIAVCGA